MTTSRHSDIPLEELQGQIERITYTNEESGYTIARLKVRGQRDLVTVVGNLTAPTPGEILRMKGRWTSHPKYGEQFQVVFYQTAVPATVYGIRKYLGSGLIKGVGPVIAERIVKQFGADTLDIIEERVEDLSQVDGIGKKRVAMIRKAWADQKEIREVMLFLQSHGVSAGYATKIFKQYGNQSIAVVRENPYRLATDIWGIGFVTADRIAEKLGIPRNSPIRAQAGILYVLNQMADEGHVYYPYDPLIDKCREILEVDRDLLVEAFAAVEADKKIRIEDLNEDPDDFQANFKAIYLTQFHVCETGIARRLKALKAVPKNIRQVDEEKALVWAESQLGITLAEEQKTAVRRTLDSKVLVITGGPGTGKTTLINAVLRIWSAMGARILMAAPTGRAARRMSDTTGHTAATIHRLLKFSPAKAEFEMNDKNPLDCDILILDEMSMVDTILMHHLLKAVPVAATLVMVGDVNQLPSVGPGSVLGDIIASGAVPVVTLSKIFRQAEASRIITNAHRINAGRMPIYGNDSPESDFYFIEKEDPEAVRDIILRLVKERIPDRFGHHPIDDIQVLSPMNRGIVGAVSLNKALQSSLNPREDGIVRGQRTFNVGDKVMQLRNNYDKSVFNGDIGRIIRIQREDQELLIRFEGRDVVYDYSDLDEVSLAYAVSVHKSQGSEYPAVVIPVLIQHYMLLQRNLIYTAVTRAKKLAVLVGTRKAVAIGVRNAKTRKRYTFLHRRLA